MKDEFIIGGLIILILALGIFVGVKIGKNIIQGEAVELNKAEWAVTGKYGSTEFKWLDNAAK
jgi:hypothetical protein